MRLKIRFRQRMCSVAMHLNCFAYPPGEPRGPLADGGASASFRCRRNKGAFLSLPFNATRQDAIRTKVFETYIRRHCDGWLEFADRLGFDAKLEDILFVTGCDLTTSWAMATFVNHPLDAEITLTVESSGTQAPSARFQWSATNQPHNNELTQVRCQE